MGPPKVDEPWPQKPFGDLWWSTSGEAQSEAPPDQLRLRAEAASGVDRQPVCWEMPNKMELQSINMDKMKDWMTKTGALQKPQVMWSGWPVTKSVQKHPGPEMKCCEWQQALKIDFESIKF